MLMIDIKLILQYFHYERNFILVQDMGFTLI